MTLVAHRLRGLGERLEAPLERLTRVIAQLPATVTATGAPAPTAATVGRLQRAGERLRRLRRQLARLGAALAGSPSPARLATLASACADQLSSPAQVVALAAASLRADPVVPAPLVDELETAVAQLHELSRRVRALGAALPAQPLRTSFDGAAELEG